MIQVMTVTAEAVCRNCGTVIERGRGDMERDERWWHDKGGLATCPGAPEADPNPASIVERATR